MSTYSSREYTDMILSLGACGGNASAAVDHYRHRYPNRRHPDRRVIQRAERTLGEYGSFEKLRRHGGRRRRVSSGAKKRLQGEAAKKWQHSEEEIDEEEEEDEEDDDEEDDESDSDTGKKPKRRRWSKKEEDEKEDKDEKDFDDNSFNESSGETPKDFTSGAFVVAKADIGGNTDPTLWRTDGKALLQKFLPFKENGKTLYKSTSTYSGWSVNNKDKYLAAQVTFKVQSRTETIIELHLDQHQQEFVKEEKED